MATIIAARNRLNHSEDAIIVLNALCSSERTPEGVRFCFDLERREFWVAVTPLDDADGFKPLSLAIYNDLKLSQYILEEDHSSTRERRYFKLTPLGRAAAAALR